MFYISAPTRKGLNWTQRSPSCKKLILSFHFNILVPWWARKITLVDIGPRRPSTIHNCAGCINWNMWVAVYSLNGLELVVSVAIVNGNNLLSICCRRSCRCLFNNLSCAAAAGHWMCLRRLWIDCHPTHLVGWHDLTNLARWLVYVNGVITWRSSMGNRL